MEFTKALVEAPHDEDGYYLCSCGTDRHGQPYNRRSVMHAHKVEFEHHAPLGNVIAAIRYIQLRYGKGR